MKRILLMSLTGALAMSFSSCREDLGTEMLNAVPLQVTATTGTDARAIHESTILPAGSELGVSVFDVSGNAYEGRADGTVNIPYRLQKVEGQDVWQADAPVSLSATEGKAVAYYPYSASVTDIHAIPVDVTKSQTDFLYSGWVSGVSATSPQADFTLRHALCAVRVNITDGGYTGAGKVTSVSVSSPALATVATLDAADGSFPSFFGQDTPVTSSGGFTISQDPQSASLLAVPTGEAAGLSIRVAMDGNTFTVPFSSSPVTFLPGKVYTVNLTAKDGEAPFEVNGTVGISTDWSTVVLQNPTMDPDEIQVPDRYVIEIEIPTDNFSFYSNVGKFTGVIEWGDGKSESYSNATLPVHFYEKAGKYLVTAKGMCNGLSWYSSNNSIDKLLVESKKCLIDIRYIGGGMGIISMYHAFKDCSNLKSLRKGIFDNLTLVTKFYDTFSGCNSLQSIPAGLFDNCTKVTTFSRTFYKCSSLQIIPAGLFDNCTKVTNFSETFSGCNSLQSIPAGLFDNCPNVTSFSYTFSGCRSLQSIPAGLFDNCTRVTDFSRTFYKCSSLQIIPAGLFDNCPNVTRFSETFSECSSLQSIPAGLFDNCTKVTTFYGTFSECSSLQIIPAGLFDNCPNVTRFSETFSGCSGLTSIPVGLFDNCTKVTNFYGTFSECSSLQSIPAGLFDNCTEVTNFNRTFYECRSLQSIPAGLFDYCTRVTDFGNTFISCGQLSGESPYTVIDGVKIHLYEREKCTQYFTKPTFTEGCFRSCTNLTEYSKIPSSWK